MENRNPVSRSLIFVALLLAGLLVAGGLGPAFNHHEGAALAGAGEPSPAQIVEIIAKAVSAAQLEPYLTHSEPIVVRAAIVRLGELASADSVTLLSRLFDAQPRESGTGARGGFMVDALRALAATGREDARIWIGGIIDKYITSGPLIKGIYAHMHDPQYYEVLQAALFALGTFDGPDSVRRLQALSGNESLHYSIREAAWTGWLECEIRAKKLQGREQVEFLLTQMNADGVFIEKQWKAGQPGNKTLAAGKQHVVEEMILRTGWSAAEPVKDYMFKETGVERKVAAARILTALIGERFQEQIGNPGADEKEAVQAVLGTIARLPETALASPTIAAIFDNLKGSVDHLADAALWENARTVQGRLKIPGSWEGAPPDPAKMKLSMPETTVFLPDLSRKIPSQYGTLIEACYLIEADAAGVVAHLEKCTGIRAQPVPGYDPGQKESAESWIAYGQVPSEFAGIVEPGVRIVPYPEGFEVKAFGKVLARGRTMVIITAVQR